MAIFTQSISAADVLAGLTTDDTKWKGANIDARLNQIDFWSAPKTGSVILDTTAGDEVLPSVTLPNITGKTILAAYGMVSFSAVKNTGGGANGIDVAQVIQVDKAAAGYITALNLVEVDCMFTADGTRKGNTWIGSHDIVSRVAFNVATDFKWIGADATASSLTFQGFRSGVRVIV